MKKILEDYLASWAHLPKQGSQEWLDNKTINNENRDITIGGSEIHMLMGGRSIKGLIRNKLGLTTFKGNKYTGWGNICEDINKRFCEIKYNTTIYELGSIPGYTNEVVLQTYSPDGLAIIDEDIVLFEFKCPFSRKINNIVPKKYISQIQLGLSTINICKYAIYSEMKAKICKLKDFTLTNSNYYEPFHDKKDIPNNEPSHLYLICVYTKDRQLYDNDKSLIENLVELYDNDGFIDSDILSDNISKKVYQALLLYDGFVSLDGFGKSFVNASASILNLINEYIDLKKTNESNLFYPSIFCDKEKCVNEYISEVLDEFNTFCQKENFSKIGVLPVKIFNIGFHKIEKDEGFLEKVIPLIEDFHEKLNEEIKKKD